MEPHPFRLLHLPNTILADMIQHALAEAPLECCGLLAGKIEGLSAEVGKVVHRYPLVNAAASPVEYLSEPRSLFEATRAIRTRNLDLLAVYHSHPTSQPIPSRIDLERNYSSEVVNFIVSLSTTPPTVRAWWLAETEYQEADWLTVP
jgi:proteasome lid subunit RPN8/RPN11